MKSEVVAIGKSNKKHRIAVVYLLITALLWSAGGLFIKLINWNPMAIAGGRSFIAALLMLAVIRKPRIKLSWTFVCGALAYACTVILFVTSTRLTTAANAILLQYTAPIYVALLGPWLLKEKTTILDHITILVVLIGMVLFFIGDLSSEYLLGNILAILSGVTFALLIMLLRKYRDESPLEVTFWGNVVAALVCLPFIFTSEFPNAKSVLGLLLLGVFQLGLSYIFYSSAIKHVTAIEGILIPVIEPVLNPIWVMLLMGEIPGFWSIVGGIVIVAAIVLRGIINARVQSR